MKYRLLILLMICTTVAGLSSCDESLSYSHYEHAPLTGWEKNDTLIFCTRPVAKTGRYHIEVGLRTTNDYPFTSVSLNIEQYISSQAVKVNYKPQLILMEKNGKIRGQGVSLYQYTMPVADIKLQQGDSVRFCIRHDMKREILPGIADVGITLTRR